VELFTSQGCSSCPAADKCSATGRRSVADCDQPVVDVWDYLGWKDTLANPRNTARWQAYAKARGDRERYTPQVVVNGAAHAVGSDRAAIEKVIDKSRQNKAVMSVPVAATRNGDRLAIVLPNGAPAAPAMVSVWGLAKAVTVMITRGENKGRTVTYHNVVRRCATSALDRDDPSLGCAAADRGRRRRDGGGAGAKRHGSNAERGWGAAGVDPIDHDPVGWCSVINHAALVIEVGYTRLRTSCLRAQASPRVQWHPRLKSVDRAKDVDGRTGQP
jgi:hypothetical protein